MATLKTWVSTAMVGSPNASFMTTLAVLRPTPGRLCRASRFVGTSLPCSSISILESLMTFFALELKRPMVLIFSLTPSSPRATIFSGVSATAKSAGVASLTLLSVA